MKTWRSAQMVRWQIDRYVFKYTSVYCQDKYQQSNYRDNNQQHSRHLDTGKKCGIFCGIRRDFIQEIIAVMRAFRWAILCLLFVLTRVFHLMDFLFINFFERCSVWKHFLIIYYKLLFVIQMMKWLDKSGWKKKWQIDLNKRWRTVLMMAIFAL